MIQKLIKKIYILYSLLFLLFTSCFEKDKRIQPYPGEVITIDKDIEKNQSYFDFETGKVVKTHPADTWQLGFECGIDGCHIIVNSGAGWLIYDTKQAQIDADVTPPREDLWSYDIQSYFPDSTAIGNWFIMKENEKYYSNNVYLVGKYSGSGFLSIKHLVFVEVTDSTYLFFYKESENNFSDTVLINKTDSSNYVYYSFANKQQVNLEPDKAAYDIVFCPYYDLATNFGVTIPYLVRGVLLNVWQTTAVLDSINTYDQIDFEMPGNYDFSAQRDIIGYKWKEVNVDISGGTAIYAVKSNYIYLILTAEGNYYKFHFLSFMLNGTSGFPQFEYQQLQ
jgi:hypothetical protein